MSNVTFSTGNPTVDAVGQLRLEGNIIPHAWYHTIKYPNGKPNLVAINILADIVYFYRPKINRDEESNTITAKKKFKEDVLQRSYDQLAEYFGITKRQATDNVIFLEKLGVIKRDFRTIISASGVKSSNVLFIKLLPKGLFKLTYPGVDAADFRDTSHVVPGDPPTLKRETLPRYNGTPPTLERETNTESSSEISTKISTKIIYGEFVSLSDDQYKKLVEKFGQQEADEKIETLDIYIGSTGKKYSSHYHTILSWARKEEKESREKSGKNKAAEKPKRKNDLPF
jgi:hypothetical protein